MARKYNKKVTCLYMKVTDDKYELPLAVADSVKDLARMCNSNKNTISSCLHFGYGTYRKVDFKGD